MIKKFIKTDELLLSLINIEKTLEKYKDVYKDANTILKTSVKSQKMAVWKCDKGHEWDDRITNVSNHRKCPYCAGKYLLDGINDLQTMSPELAEEWHPSLNEDLYPSNISYYSEKSVWWRCTKGHSWKSKVSRRAEGSICTKCSKNENLKFNAYIVCYYIKKYVPETIFNYKFKNYIIKIFVPSIRLGIEYDYNISTDKELLTDVNKNKTCLDNGIILIRIRDANLPRRYYNTINSYQRPNKKWGSLENIIKQILRKYFKISNSIINIENDIDDIHLFKNRLQTINHVQDEETVETELDTKQKKGNLTMTNKKLIKEWNNRKNRKIKPYHFSKFSNRIVWWRCSLCKHEWEEEIRKRASKNKLICPACGVH